MKNLKLLSILIALTALTSCGPRGSDSTGAVSPVPTSTSPVTTDGQERGGGDAREIRNDLRDAEIDQLVMKLEWAFTNPANPSVRRMTSSLLSRADLLPNGIAKKSILDMVERGVVKALWKTKFVFSQLCVDTFEGKKRSATAVMNATSTEQYEICIDLKKIASDLGPQIPDGELVGLMVHELAHFYGYLDADRKIATTVARFMVQEASAIDGESLYFLVPTEHQTRWSLPKKVSGISEEAIALRKRIGDVATPTDRKTFEKLWANARAKQGASANWTPDPDDDLMRATSVTLKNEDGSTTTCHRAPPLSAYLSEIQSVIFPEQYLEKPEGAVQNPAGVMAYRCYTESSSN
jgi:hypothetical protein